MTLLSLHFLSRVHRRFRAWLSSPEWCQKKVLELRRRRSTKPGSYFVLNEQNTYKNRGNKVAKIVKRIYHPIVSEGTQIVPNTNLNRGG